MSAIERVLRRVDGYQQTHGALGFPFAVVKKFGDDRGGSLAALIAYYGVLSLFPLLLLVTTAFGYLLGHSAKFEESVVHSALAQFPIIGDQIQRNVHSLRASGFGVVVGVVGLLWGGLGVTQAAQHAMNQVWNVPGVVRPGFFPRQVRGLLFLGALGVGVLGTTVLSGLGALGSKGLATRTVLLVASAGVNVGLFVLVFRVLTAKAIAWRPLVPGAVAAGLAWQILQTFGGYLVAHQLRQTTQVYGFFAVVLGLMGWLFLGAQVTIYCAELNVVWSRRLWPRSLLQPPLTEADERTLAAIAEQEERRPEQTVDVTFE
ncbi:MAG: YihY/virulence factor BrkB family protein [Actinobacteria bacterium]|nr:YihY/virulence factor BrkB family protein [Actinomycetota bacterium]